MGRRMVSKDQRGQSSNQATIGAVQHECCRLLLGSLVKHHMPSMPKMCRPYKTQDGTTAVENLCASVYSPAEAAKLHQLDWMASLCDMLTSGTANQVPW